MEPITVKYKVLDTRAKVPSYATPGSAAADLCAVLDAPLTLAPMERALVPTGLAIELPGPHSVALVYARSGLSIKHGLCMANGVGVVDSDYRGELKVPMVNLGREAYTILPGEHIVIFQLQPAHTGVVYIGKAQHAGQKFPLRVPALGVLIDADAGDAVLFTKIPHAVGGVALHAVAQKAVVGGAVTEFFQQLRFVQLQYFRKALRGKAELFLRHLARGGPQLSLIHI